MTLRTAAAFLKAFRFPAPLVLLALLALAAAAGAEPIPVTRSTAPYRPAATTISTQPISVAGTWIDSNGHTWVLTQDASGNIGGTVDTKGACPCGQGKCTGENKSPIWPVSGQLNGLYLTLIGMNPATGNVCTSTAEYDVTIAGITAMGTYTTAAGTNPVSMKLTPTCNMLLNGTLTVSQSNNFTQMGATFEPAINQDGWRLSDAATLCGFVAWDWVQQITHMPNPSPFYEANLGDPAAPFNLNGNSVPFYDPPAAGYTDVPTWISYPFYYDPTNGGQPWSLSAWTFDANGLLEFADNAADYCIPNFDGTPSAAYTKYASNRAECGNATTAPGESIGYSTMLAGINADGSASTVGIGFNWSDSYNGTNGGIATTASTGPVDPGSGTGGITIISVTTSVPVSTNPTITPGGIITADQFGAFTSAAPGSWIEIYGTGLAADSRLWTSADFKGNTAPTSLDGTTVTVGGQSAVIDYISPTQVNAQVPSNTGTGPQPVIVSSATGTSAPVTLTVNLEEPGLLAPPSFKIGGTQYVVALFSDAATYVLPPGAISGVTSRRAQPGDIITLYGVGFGSVTPSIPPGQVVQQLNTLAAPFHLLFGQTEATLQYDGLAPSLIGLYQFNVTVPNVTASDAVPVTFTLAGVAGTQTLYIAVQN